VKASSALVVLGTVALAGLADAAPTKKLLLADLPQATVGGLPAMDKRPSEVDAAGRVAGLTISPVGPGMPAPPRRNKKGKMSPAPIVPGQVQVQVAGNEGSCVSVLVQGRDTFRSTPMFVDASEGVLPIRVESITEKGDAASLTIVDAWVDPTSGGAKEIRHVDIPLAKVAQGPAGAPAYAFRDGNVIQLVTPAGSNAQLSNPDGQTFASSCGVLRGELAVEKGKSATMTGFFTHQTKPIEAKDGFAAVPPMAFRVAISASASQTSRDPEPLLSFVVRPLDPIPEMPRQRIAQTE
jgi:hypothetical protein